MSNLYRLVYASAATVQFSNESGGVEPAVARILTKSRRNNPKRKITGVLYYGNGYFFQCLEGPKEEVTSLADFIKQDPRHENFKVLLAEEAEKPLFGSWSMKKVSSAEKVNRFLAKQGMKKFDPMQLDEDKLRLMLIVLADAYDEPLSENTENQEGWFANFKRRLFG